MAGAGVVGLAIARSLALQGREVLVLEQQQRIGSAASSRNSEVVHAGLYYPRDFLKTQLCIRGRELLYGFCRARGVEHRRLGKLVVATTSAELPRLRRLIERATENGVPLEWLEPEAVREREPELNCAGALWSPESGIVDSHGLMMALLADVESAGGLVLCGSPVHRVGSDDEHGFLVSSGEPVTEIACDVFVNSAGTGAQRLAAHTAPLSPALIPAQRLSKGHYFALNGRSPFRHLIYPLPEARGLGIHVTLDLQGMARFGPDSVGVETEEHSFDETRRGAFLEAIRRYYPAIRDDRLRPDYTGIRSQLVPPQDAVSPQVDFVVQGPAAHGVPGLVNLFGIESPGLTAALAIGDYVAGMLESERRSISRPPFSFRTA